MNTENEKIDKQNDQFDSSEELDWGVGFFGTTSLLHQLAADKLPFKLDLDLKKGDWLRSINDIDDEGNTPFHIAAKFGNIPILIKLAVGGADISIKNKLGETALSQAYISDKTLSFLDPEGNTPLHKAALQGNLVELQRLIRNGADCSVKNAKGETALNQLCNPKEIEEFCAMRKAAESFMRAASISVCGIDLFLHD